MLQLYEASKILFAFCVHFKRDAFGFTIVNFPFMSNNISSAPEYGVYASQLIRYARCCSNYSDFYHATGP